MKQYKTVLAFGDSHTAGCELASVNTLEEYLQGTVTLEQADDPGKKLAYPQKLADLLGIPCENYALTGGSNERSLRKLIENIQDNCIVLFGYTSPDRREFFYPDEGLFLGRDNDNYIQTGVQWTGMIDIATKSSPMTHPINNEYLNIVRHKDNIDAVQNFVSAICTAHNCKVMDIALCETQNPMFNYLDWCRSENYKQLPYLHYEEQAHNRLAEKLWQTIGDIT
tara:strand:- start:1850 stop:2521 length:672 start_codon:yes stop_codon:yes gene_type:complete